MVLYLIRNTQTGREYVGTTTRTLSRRWSDHKSACFTKRENSPLYGDMRAFGVDAFEVTTLEEVEDYDTLLARERAEILKRQTLYPHGYNQVKGGRGNYGWVPSPDVRRNMSAGQRGRVLSSETRAKIAAFFTGRPKVGKKGVTPWNKGVRATPEHRAKLSAAHKGRKHSEETKARMSASASSRCGTSEVRARLSANKTAWWAGLIPEARAAHVQKVSLGHKGK